MSKDEWYEKLREWARDDVRLYKLPFMLMTPLAEYLANYEAVEHTPAADGADSIPSPCPYHLYGTDDVHVITVDRCSHPKRKEWRDRLLAGKESK